MAHPVDNSSVRVYGWKPTDAAGRSAAVRICYELGASREEAEKFARYNGARHWSAVDGTCSVADLAKLWVDEWAERNESAWAYERNRRKQSALVRT